MESGASRFHAILRDVIRPGLAWLLMAFLALTAGHAAPTRSVELNASTVVASVRAEERAHATQYRRPLVASAPAACILGRRLSRSVVLPHSLYQRPPPVRAALPS